MISFLGFDRHLGLGVISNKNYLIETPQEVANEIRMALQYVAPERIHLTGDCGLFAYSRPAAKAKLRAMVKGADLMRQEAGVKGLVTAASWPTYARNRTSAQPGFWRKFHDETKH